jgi:uncharacterized membrane protein
MLPGILSEAREIPRFSRMSRLVFFLSALNQKMQVRSSSLMESITLLLFSFFFFCSFCFFFFFFYE